MASELNYDKLVKLVKDNNDITQALAAEKLGLSIGQVSMLKFCQAQVEAKVYTKAPATEASIKKLRDSEGNRWELIAARTGLSVAAVKEKYPGDPAKSYTGRGRNFNGAATSGRGGKTRPTASKKKTAARAGSKKKTATRSSGTKKNASKTGGVVRRTTRRSTASNPS